jgi:transcriptional regulator with XRE-family HTH domain
MIDDTSRAAISAQVAHLLSEERKKCGLSMNRLAEKAGISQSLVSAIEKGPWNLTLDTLLRIAEVLEINAGDILGQAIRDVQKSKGPSHADRKRKSKS